MWYAANRFGGWTLMGSSVLYLVFALFFPCPTPAGMALLPWLLHLAAFAGPLLLSVLLIRRYAKSL